jgi:hypothetical protein
MRGEDIVAMDFAANYRGNHRPSSEWPRRFQMVICVPISTARPDGI